VTWPEFDEEKLAESVIEIPVQVNGKLRARMKIAADADQDSVEAAARQEVSQHLEQGTVVKVIVVPGRMVNFVVKP
jgi:leucyl-tRNA synthetase